MDDGSKKEKYKGRMPMHLRNTIKGKAVSPLVVVTDSQGQKPLLSFCSTGNNAKSVKKLSKGLKKKLKANPHLIAGVADAKEDQEDKADNDYLAESQEWINKDGKKITAAVAGVTETHVQFIMPNGKEVRYPLAKLSAESRETLEGLK